MPEAFRNPKKPDVTAASKDKNEYIPSFIANKPFYVPDTDDSGKDYLEHQRAQKKEDDSLATSQWYDRGKKKGPAATKFRKGACENCGAITHKTKECLSRKRKIGAKYSGKDIQADEVVADVNLGWDAKRDRWNGYDAEEYQEVILEYNELEALKKASKGEDGEGNEGDEGDRYEEETDMGRQQATSTRNLRLREDTAKYLLNLDLDSAKYDPKTRSLVDSGAQHDLAAALVAEEGFIKKSGDAAEFERAQTYAWEAQERSGPNKIHLQANPTAGEFTRKKELVESNARRDAQKQALLNKYGNQPDHSELKNLALAESERYVEYDEQGGIKGAIIAKPKSKYAEDILINNHTSVWGSWWSDFKWGYACCHSIVKNSYCTGDEGKRAFDEANRLRVASDLDFVGDQKKVAWKDDEVQAELCSNVAEDVREVKANLMQDSDNRKRTLDEMKNGITEEEMEEYKRQRTQSNDPMAKLLGKDQLVS